MKKVNYKVKKTKLKRAVLEFIKLQLAGNILFWGTFVGFAFCHEILNFSSLASMLLSSLAANILTFLVDKNWVFASKAVGRKARQQIMRFTLFSILNFFINIAIVILLEEYWQISPYAGQFVAGFFFTIWSFVGLKFWVFATPHHAHAARRYGLSLEIKKSYQK